MKQQVRATFDPNLPPAVLSATSIDVKVVQILELMEWEPIEKRMWIEEAEPTNLQPGVYIADGTTYFEIEESVFKKRLELAWVSKDEGVAYAKAQGSHHRQKANERYRAKMRKCK